MSFNEWLRYDFNDHIGFKWQGQFSKDPDSACQMVDLDLTVAVVRKNVILEVVLGIGLEWTVQIRKQWILRYFRGSILKGCGF